MRRTAGVGDIITVAIKKSLDGATGTVGITDYAQLPREAQDYLAKLEALCEIPIDIVSTGPDRSETIVRRHPFAE